MSYVTRAPWILKFPWKQPASPIFWPSVQLEFGYKLCMFKNQKFSVPAKHINYLFFYLFILFLTVHPEWWLAWIGFQKPPSFSCAVHPELFSRLDNPKCRYQQFITKDDCPREIEPSWCWNLTLSSVLEISFSSFTFWSRNRPTLDLLFAPLKIACASNFVNN